MVSTDPIADMLTRIRNAVAVRKSEISLPHSNVKETLARVLKEANFVDDVEVVKETVGKQLIVKINNPDANARITSIDRMSTPGKRMYAKADEIPTIRQGRGVVIVSTSHGVMTGQEAKTKRLGGELICKIS
jgi:small subunit ribosomal protein S8